MKISLVKNLLLAILLLVAVGGAGNPALFAKSLSDEVVATQPIQRYFYDLDGDSHDEEIRLMQFAENDQGQFYQLQVHDYSGKIIWSGPTELNSQNPLVFGEWHFGISLPQVVGDVDGDSTIELIATAPQSDISPTVFRVLRWKSRKFKPVRIAALLESPMQPGQFVWTSGSESTGTWVSSFLSIDSSGQATVEITDYQGGMDVKQRRASILASPNGFELIGWLDEEVQSLDKQTIPTQNKSIELTKKNAYQQYITAYKRFTRLVEENKGDTPQGRQAYEAYSKAKKHYKQSLTVTDNINKKRSAKKADGKIESSAIQETTKSQELSEKQKKASASKDKKPIFLSDEMYEFYNTPAQVIYFYTVDSLFSRGGVSNVGSPKISKKRVSIKFVKDGKKKTLIFKEISRKGDEATVSVGSPKAKKKTLHHLRKVNGRWGINDMSRP